MGEHKFNRTAIAAKNGEFRNQNKERINPMAQSNPIGGRGVQVDINNLDGYHCPECRRDTFKKIWALRELPAVLSQTGKPQLIEVHIAFGCLECGWVGTVPEMVKMSKLELEEYIKKMTPPPPVLVSSDHHVLDESDTDDMEDSIIPEPAAHKTCPSCQGRHRPGACPVANPFRGKVLIGG